MGTDERTETDAGRRLPPGSHGRGQSADTGDPQRRRRGRTRRYGAESISAALSGYGRRPLTGTL